MNESSTELISRWREGDEAAAAELHRRYIEQLLRIVGGHLSQRMQSRIDADDVCQSVFRSVFRRVRHGEFEFHDDADVWKLLISVSLNKLRSKQRQALARKRDVSREEAMGDLRQVDPFVVQCLSRKPNMAEAAALAELWDQIVARLPSDCQDLLRMRIEGYSQQEIADQLKLSTRTIRRMHDRIADVLADLFREETSDDPQ